MPRDVLAEAEAAALLRRQEVLQAEAVDVLRDLHLPAVLTPAGQPIQVGSSVLGLMVWPDLDFNVLCPRLQADQVFETMRPLASHPRVRKLRYANETAAFNRTGQPHNEGYYWGVRYLTPLGVEWKLDVWFLPAEMPRPEMTLLQTLPPQLTPEMRLSILWIKDVWHRLRAYRDQVLSVDIYDAVLAHGVRTPDAFDAYLQHRSNPTRRETAAR